MSERDLTSVNEVAGGVYPTVEALRKQDPRLSEAEARKILNQIEK